MRSQLWLELLSWTEEEEGAGRSTLAGAGVGGHVLPARWLFLSEVGQKVDLPDTSSLLALAPKSTLKHSPLGVEGSSEY